jgi:Phosphoglucomutase/phosphomannomutase, alpha/beta/alpha domain III
MSTLAATSCESCKTASRRHPATSHREHQGTTIVTDSVTSNGLSDFIAGLGGRHFRFQRGYKNVINKGIALAKEGVDCQLMMETRCAQMVQHNCSSSEPCVGV